MGRKGLSTDFVHYVIEQKSKIRNNVCVYELTKVPYHRQVAKSIVSCSNLSLVYLPIVADSGHEVN